LKVIDYMKKRIIIIIAAAAIITAAAGAGAYAFFLRGGAALAVNATQLSVGEKYLVELNYEKATATLENVIAVEPNNTEAYLALAKAYRYMGDTDTARETLEHGYDATNSAVIGRELSELSRTDGGTGNSPVNAGAATAEIAGRTYQADITELILRDCGLTDADMAKLSGFTSLERLDVSGNGITDLSAIASLTALRKLYAANNAVTDVSPLSGLRSLEYIGLRGNSIADADALFSLGSLKYLHLSDNQITSVPNIGGNLKLLYLANNKLGDTAAVKNAGLLYCDVGGNAGM
jgi:tetratricopeptide (TPR) repeat protein